MKVCKTCKSDDLGYWDNALMCTTFDWGYYCNVCKTYIDPYDGVENIEETNGIGTQPVRVL